MFFAKTIKLELLKNFQFAVNCFTFWDTEKGFNKNFKLTLFCFLWFLMSDYILHRYLDATGKRTLYYDYRNSKLHLTGGLMIDNKEKTTVSFCCQSKRLTKRVLSSAIEYLTSNNGINSFQLVQGQQ